MARYVFGDELKLKRWRDPLHGRRQRQVGQFCLFRHDHAHHPPEHVMASGALPPAFPAVEIEGEHYWDDGLFSNTPLQWVVDSDKSDWAVQGQLSEVARGSPTIRMSSEARAVFPDARTGRDAAGQRARFRATTTPYAFSSRRDGLAPSARILSEPHATA